MGSLGCETFLSIELFNQIVQTKFKQRRDFRDL